MSQAIQENLPFKVKKRKVPIKFKNLSLKAQQTEVNKYTSLILKALAPSERKTVHALLTKLTWELLSANEKPLPYLFEWLRQELKKPNYQQLELK